MAHEILLEFLKLGLIDLGGSDERLDKLNKTALEVAGILKKNPSKTVSYALVALDPKIQADEPSVGEILSALEKNWPTYPNAFSDVPISLVRAILLDALVGAADGDDDIAVAFACIARNMMPHSKAGPEQQVWTKVVHSVERNVDDRASKEWTTPASLGVGDLSIPADATEVAGKISRKPINRETLKAKLVAALVPNQQGGQNPYYPHNNPVEWTRTASNGLSEVIADAIDGGLKSVEFSGGDIAGPFDALAGAVTKYVESVAQSITVAAGGLDRRTNLLWWREALYSPSERVSYREISVTSAAALMALDVSNLVPVFSPSSVTAFIQEAVRALDSADERKSLRVLIEEVRSTPELTSLRTAAKNFAPSIAGRGPLLAVIAQPDGAIPDDNAFIAAVGVGYGTQLRPTDWANWIYSELQALKAVQKPRKSRKSA